MVVKHTRGLGQSSRGRRCFSPAEIDDAITDATYSARVMRRVASAKDILAKLSETLLSAVQKAAEFTARIGVSRASPDLR